jgi:hypothetical protein
MKITKRKLTLNVNAIADNATCVAGCHIDLNLAETAALLNPFHAGFRLSCVLLGCDPGPDKVIFTYPVVKTMNLIENITGQNHVFTADVGISILDEDTTGADEIRARFTLLDLSNGQSVVKTSNRVDGVF